ncbi:MAG: tellurite resistance TerB family protein [Rhodospirillaceae bacterium]|nr:tellurite resistance TerB family protein [Rhodospirillaceae bacterium]
MAGFLSALKKSYATQMQRHQNKAFLNATMAACALVATADGRVTFSETVRVDQIVETLEQLRAFDPVEAADLFRDFCDAVLDNPKEGHNKLATILENMRGNQETAELLIRICLAVTEADGKSSLVDQIEIVSLCSLLELDPAHFGLYRGQMIDELGKDGAAPV